MDGANLLPIEPVSTDLTFTFKTVAVHAAIDIESVTEPVTGFVIALLDSSHIFHLSTAVDFSYMGLWHLNLLNCTKRYHPKLIERTETQLPEKTMHLLDIPAINNSRAKSEQHPLPLASGLKVSVCSGTCFASHQLRKLVVQPSPTYNSFRNY